MIPATPTPAPAAGSRRLRGPLSAALAVLVLAGGTGCGIRGTSVPVDAGPAPSRASCRVPDGPAPVPDSGKEAQTDVHLVCGAQIMPVKRVVPRTEGRTEEDRLRLARALLTELQTPPSRAEDDGGFSSEVPDGLEVGAPRDGDPGSALRLSRIPDELPAYALAQLVCTFAGTAAVAGDESVVLGGPGDDPLKRFPCTEELRARPEAAQTTGVPVT
ncbi:hypothetical protein [Streptomyces albus]|uniref:hypothetical protein n=1 Tax=Streptomyces albus TaxID=1888 RepID=UPI000A73264D|nr:hypothetical protein [Streptomyces albus]